MFIGHGGEVGTARDVESTFIAVPPLTSKHTSYLTHHVSSATFHLLSRILPLPTHIDNASLWYSVNIKQNTSLLSPKLLHKHGQSSRSYLLVSLVAAKQQKGKFFLFKDKISSLVAIKNLPCAKRHLNAKLQSCIFSNTY